MKHFFISYTGADRAWAEWIAWQLEAADYSVVLQAWDFRGNWVLEIDRAMKESERTIAVLSPRYLAARYTYPEWAGAFQRDPKSELDLLIPVRIEAVTLTGILAPISYVDLIDADETTARERLLRRVRGDRGKPTAAPTFPAGATAKARPAFPLPEAAGAADAGRPPGLVHAPPTGWESPVGRRIGRYKVVAFDLDGTLIRGDDFAFSWERVWEALKFSRVVRRNLRNAYRQQAARGVQQRTDAYRSWCEQAIAHFRQRGLTRHQLTGFASGLALTANCREVLRTLRQAGVVTAIISGGIDTFLKDVFPDVSDYVDFVFINELTFDEAGTVAGVNATSFDFEGKADALDLVCRLTGASHEETAFVGDQFNDEAIMLRAELAIAYPPGDTVAKDSARVAIFEDDLRQILPHVLVE